MHAPEVLEVSEEINPRPVVDIYKINKRNNPRKGVVKTSETYKTSDEKRGTSNKLDVPRFSILIQRTSTRHIET
jgi:hypothetical protein